MTKMSDSESELNKDLKNSLKLSAASDQIEPNLTEEEKPIQTKFDKEKKLHNFKKSLQKEGHVDEENGQFSYVANNFIEQLKAQDKSPSRSSTDIPNINPQLLDNIDEDCRKLTLSVDSVIEELTKRLHEISAISVANTQTCSTKINDLQLCVDTGVHNVYSLIAHCEELDQLMKPMYGLAEKIAHLKDIVNTLESHIQ